MGPRLRRIESEHVGHYLAHLQLQRETYRRRLAAYVVGVVEHAGEVAHHAGHGLFRYHVGYVTGRIYGVLGLEQGENPRQLVAQTVEPELVLTP